MEVEKFLIFSTGLNNPDKPKTRETHLQATPGSDFIT
jgi:hypothetical protein